MANIKILANRYNNLQARIEAIYGDPVSSSSTTGYGQTTRSNQVDSFSITPKSFNSATDVNYSTNTISIPGHGLVNEDVVEYDPEGNDPIMSNVFAEAHYYIKRINNSIIELYYDQDLLNIVNLTDTGASGNHVLNHLEGDLISASDYFNLYLDLAASRVHQIGSSYSAPNSALLEQGDLVVAQYITDLETLMNLVEADKNNIDANQLTLQNLKDGTGTDINAVRTTRWNGTITHEFNVTFQDTGARTGYFNAAGDIRLSQSLTGGSGTKTADWRNMLNAVGTIIFDRSGVTQVGGTRGSVTAVTPYTLTTTYQTLFSISGASYLDNEMDIAARFSGSNIIRIRIRFRDLDTGGDVLPGGTFGPDPVDEDVNGTISSNVSINKPAGQFVVGGTTYASVNFTVTGLNISSL